MASRCTLVNPPQPIGSDLSLPCLGCRKRRIDWSLNPFRIAHILIGASDEVQHGVSKQSDRHAMWLCTRRSTCTQWLITRGRWRLEGRKACHATFRGDLVKGDAATCLECGRRAWEWEEPFARASFSHPYAARFWYCLTPSGHATPPCSGGIELIVKATLDTVLWLLSLTGLRDQTL